MRIDPKWAVFIALVVAAGCELSPEMAQIVHTLRLAKDDTESLAAIAKHRLLPFKKSTGQLLYGRAMAAHNATISSIGVALGNPAGLTKSDLEQLVSNADTERQKFCDWCNNTLGADPVASAEMKAMSLDLVGIASIVSDWLILIEQNRQIEVAYTRAQLEKCEWRNWDEL